jgi:hypothetical protein
MSDSLENFEQLQETIQQLQTELNSLKKIVANPPPVSADAYLPLLTNPAPSQQILELPLSRVIDLYRECPEVLQAYVQRVAVDKKHFSLEGYHSDQPLTFNVNSNGNFWVIQLGSQGHFLFPRPSDFKRFNRLDYLEQIFEKKQEINSNQDEFELGKPAKLQVLKLQKDWRLEQKGEIIYEHAPLHHQRQQELTAIRQQYEDFNQNLATFGNSALEFTITAQYWEQSLIKKYGELVTIAINTCMPIAYAIYKGPILVPCQILGGNNPRVLPGWDRGVPWEASIYATHHSKLNKDYFRTPADHPLFPNQIYLKEINQDLNPTGALATWAIAKSYDEASAILRKLIGNWGPLDLSQDNQQDNREW